MGFMHGGKRRIRLQRKRTSLRVISRMPSMGKAMRRSMSWVSNRNIRIHVFCTTEEGDMIRRIENESTEAVAVKSQDSVSLWRMRSISG